MENLLIMFGLNVKNVKVNFAMNVENLIMVSVGVLMRTNYINIITKTILINIMKVLNTSAMSNNMIVFVRSVIVAGFVVLMLKLFNNLSPVEMLGLILFTGILLMITLTTLTSSLAENVKHPFKNILIIYAVGFIVNSYYIRRHKYSVQ